MGAANIQRLRSDKQRPETVATQAAVGGPFAASRPPGGPRRGSWNLLGRVATTTFPWINQNTQEGRTSMPFISPVSH